MKLGGGEYLLCALDTNIYSELSKDPRTYFAGLRAVLGDRPWLLCFSPYSLFELRAAPAIYERFLDIFDVVPCAILKNEEQLFTAEQGVYPAWQNVDPLLFGFSSLNRPKGMNLRNLLTLVFEQDETIAREEEWPSLKVELLQNWRDLKKNYPPKGRWYQLHEARDFARRATLQQIACRDGAWVRELKRRGERLQWEAFPSVAMTLLTVFLRLYEPMGRTGVPQDVFDVLISTPTPYVDVVITEGMQAEIVRKAGKLFPPIQKVRVHTLQDLRQAIS
ncbi:MAG: hypothetical protein WEA09_05310 [Gemmatimonadota bacterium]